MPSVCRFTLDHPKGVYYSGETINGIVHLTTTKDKNVRNVRIVFLGEGKVKWDEYSAGSNDSSRTNTHYKSHVVYVNSETFVRGEGMLALGLHTYTFSITLPMQCPTSCEGEYGHIRYGLSLILDRPLRFNNVYNIPLTILQTVDSNLNPTFKLPLIAERVDSLCHWNCTGGKIIYALRIPFGAYSPGQAVKYSVCIRNQSLSDIVGYSLEFEQKMMFTALSPNRKERHKRRVLVTRASSEICLRSTSRVYEDQFRIPAIPPTTEPRCIIRVQYKLNVSVHMSGCRSSRKLSIPIFIGTIPIRESLPHSYASVAESRQVSPPSAPVLALSEKISDIPPSYYNLKPPSYQATLPIDFPFVDDDVDQHHRVVGFQPLYPMYS